MVNVHLEITSRKLPQVIELSGPAVETMEPTYPTLHALMTTK